MVYFSDGATSQYKNKENFLNLCYHEADFGVPAEQHFSATSHRKNTCDCVGGTVKRLAARASLQKRYDSQISTPFQLYEWAVDNIPRITFTYCTSAEYEIETLYLGKLSEKPQTIAGTCKVYSIILISQDTVQTLNADRMNVKQGGQQPKLRDTSWKGKMNFSLGVPKGMRLVLQERGIDTTGLKAEDMREILKGHEDFKEEKPRVLKFLEERGHTAYFLPSKEKIMH